MQFGYALLGETCISVITYEVVGDKKPPSLIEGFNQILMQRVREHIRNHTTISLYHFLIGEAIS